MTAAPRAGWYPDPGGRAQTFRWWDGTQWTDHVSDVANAPDPTEVGPTAATRGGSRHRARQVVALVLVIALVASAGVGVGLWLWRDDDSSAEARSGGVQPRTAPSTETSAPSGRLDPKSRTATIAQATMVLPDAPYALRQDPWSQRELFDAAFLAEAPVHLATAKQAPWSALVALVWIHPDLVGADLEQATRATVSRMAERMYGDAPTKVEALQTDAAAVDGYPGVMGTAEVHYAIAGLPSRHDVVAVHLVRLSDGSVVAGVISVPDDAAPGVLSAAQESLATLHVS